jgi:DcuC family C4-dicarboxylate transporter
MQSVTTLLLGAAVILLAVYAILRRVDVRLALLLGALALGGLAGDPMAIVRTFLATFANEKFVVPICTAMGFAYVLRYTQCDQHLVHLLVRPLTRVRPLLIPGTVVIGFLVNIPVVSQTSTAVTIGAVAIPILLAARLSPVTVGATLLLGSSIGGELLNPGAPELRTIVEETRKVAGTPHELTSRDCVARILPLNLLGLAVATTLFWAICARADARQRKADVDWKEELEPSNPPSGFSISPLRAAVPLVPLFLLFLTGPPLELVPVERSWLVDLSRPGSTELFDSRVIGAAMLVGAAVAALVVRQKALGVTAAFFDGAGYGFTHIISLIVTANCFGEGIKLIGLAGPIGNIIGHAPSSLLPAAGTLPLSFGVLCGSGMATTQSLFGFFVEPALHLGISPELVGAVVALAAAAGRTMSPVAAVTLMCGTLTKTNPLDLVKRVAVPLLAAISAVVIASIFMAIRS